MKDINQLNLLINKYLNRQCTPHEIDVLLQEFNHPENEEALKIAIAQYFEKSADTEAMTNAEVDAALADVHARLVDQIGEQVVVPEKRYRKMWPLATAAAAVLIFIFAGVYYLTLNRVKPQPAQLAVKQLKNDAMPGSNKAVLTLSNGSRIVLNDIKNGVIAKQAGIAVIKTGSGKVINKATNDAVANNIMPAGYNTVSTPRGGQYQVELPDGSKVWLNAASSLRYPTQFTGKQRNVELTGEAYFEVAKNAAKPFRVTSAGQTVEVLGTHFNINAYNDEKLMKTTLLEGSVKVSYQQFTALLKPGEQAKITLGTNSSIIINNDADTEEAVAWRDGYFQFNHADIQTIMRQLSRWYDVDVRYDGTVSAKQFGGAIQRNLKLSQVLHILEKSGLHFTISGKEVLVMQ
ncbi:FecR family protein [Mucilaginibacter pineti]|uniref:FecR family protein n=1 Tax=Mucilaginibacter pineti TaxID=1391627 RepID=A0A1G6X0M4_9SPHI|nr:FecR family protein [Mucilaginibacter pineti]SDD71619.1 FecR family protein [Mucilaginibacter pineti]